MHVQISCEECGRRYKIAESTVRGKRIFTRCKCGARVVVEDPSSSSSTTGSIRRTDRWFVNITTSEPLAMSLESLIRAFEVGRIDTETLVWRRGMVNWALLRDVKELAILLLGESASRELESMPPPAGGDSVPPPPPHEASSGLDADLASPALKPRAVKLRLRGSPTRTATRTGLGVVTEPPPPGDAASPADIGPNSNPPLSTDAREFAQIAASWEEKGPATEPLGPANLMQTSRHISESRQPEVHRRVASGRSSLDVPLNLVEPSKSAQTPIAMSTTSGRRPGLVSPLARIKSKHYALLAALVGGLALLGFITTPSSGGGSNSSLADNSLTENGSSNKQAFRSAPEARPSVRSAASHFVSPENTDGDLPPQQTQPTAGRQEVLQPQPAPVGPETASTPTISPWIPKVLPAPPPKSKPRASASLTVPARAAVAAKTPKPTKNEPLPPTATRSPVSAPSPALPNVNSPAPEKPSTAPPIAIPAVTPTAVTLEGSGAKTDSAKTSSAKTSSVTAVAPSAPAPAATSRSAPTAVSGASKTESTETGEPGPGEKADDSEKPVATPRGFQLAIAKVQAKAAAAEAAKCEGEPGAGRVKIMVEPWGTVGGVRHLSQAFVGTATGLCVMEAFQKIRVPRFDGETAFFESPFSIR